MIYCREGENEGQGNERHRAGTIGKRADQIAGNEQQGGKERMAQLVAPVAELVEAECQQQNDDRRRQAYGERVGNVEIVVAHGHDVGIEIGEEIGTRIGEYAANAQFGEFLGQRGKHYLVGLERNAPQRRKNDDYCRYEQQDEQRILCLKLCHVGAI